MTTETKYASLTQLKAALGISDSTDDTRLGNVLDDVSRWVDQYCGRRFYVTEADETRYFTAELAEVLEAGDVVSVTTLATDEDGDRVYERTWAATDFDLEPFNAALDGKPYTELRTAPNGHYAFPTMRRGVKIVGRFGWPAVPDPVREAVIIQAARIFRRKDAIFGVVGSGEMGHQMVLPRLDPDVKQKLDVFRKEGIGGV